MHTTAVAQQQWLAALQVELEQSVGGRQPRWSSLPDRGEAMVRERRHVVAEALRGEDPVGAVHPERQQRRGR